MEIPGLIRAVVSVVLVRERQRQLDSRDPIAEIAIGEDDTSAAIAQVIDAQKGPAAAIAVDVVAVIRAEPPAESARRRRAVNSNITAANLASLAPRERMLLGAALGRKGRKFWAGHC